KSISVQCGDRDEGVYDAEDNERHERTTGPPGTGRPGRTRRADREGATARRDGRAAAWPALPRPPTASVTMTPLTSAGNTSGTLANRRCGMSNGCENWPVPTS